jgi:hypothetical protein
MELIVCGAAEVLIYDWHRGRLGVPVWKWRAQGQSTIPAALQKRFGTTDDCKPFQQGQEILITSSGGAVALVERATGAARFAAVAPAAHSADLLPEGRVAVACSVNKDGDCLLVYDLRQPDRPVFKEPLPSAHGTVWDEERQLLWTLNYKELRAYRLHTDTTGVFSLRRGPTFPLPTNDGHDLVAVPGSSSLIVTTGRGVYTFDRDRFLFAPHPFLNKLLQVKSVSVHPKTGQTVFMQAEPPNWWTTKIHFRQPDIVAVDKTQRFYKARWMI